MISLITILLLSQLDHYEFTTISSPQTAGDSFQITIYAYDASNQIVTDYNGHPWVYSSLSPTYSNKQVSFTNGSCTDNVMVTLASNMALICNDYSGHIGQSNNFNVLPNDPATLLSIVPNETYDPGTQTGKSGSVSVQNAGVQFNINIYLTDNWFNLINTVNHLIDVIPSDQFVPQSQIQLSNGTFTLPFAFRTAGTQQRLYFNDITQSAITPDTSSWIPVSPGSYSTLLIILPGETHEPGDTTTTVVNTPGKTGDPTDQYAGSAFTVMVYASDTMWNKTSSGSQVQLYSDFSFNNPSPESLSNGAAQFMVYFTFAGSNQNLWAEDDTISSYRNYLNILMEIDTTVVPDSFMAYPNPMGIETQHMVFAYSLDAACDVIIAIYDPFGNLVKETNINSGDAGARAGRNYWIWYGDNDEGQRVASGIYYAAIKGWTHTVTIFDKKMKVGVVW
ncbi:hypothetical protein ES705_03960 [subsurface metagenome]